MGSRPMKRKKNVLRVNIIIIFNTVVNIRKLVIHLIIKQDQCYLIGKRSSGLYKVS